jgi:hypothetical protein
MRTPGELQWHRVPQAEARRGLGRLKIPPTTKAEPERQLAA